MNFHCPILFLKPSPLNHFIILLICVLNCHLIIKFQSFFENIPPQTFYNPIGSSSFISNSLKNFTAPHPLSLLFLRKPPRQTFYIPKGLCPVESNFLLISLPLHFVTPPLSPHPPPLHQTFNPLD